ncbi:MAG: BON domain-containing protein [Armatimonadetes bacterium]|nr:BON domain-containing protein [Armatimonadota bacterium]
MTARGEAKGLIANRPSSTPMRGDRQNLMIIGPDPKPNLKIDTGTEIAKAPRTASKRSKSGAASAMAKVARPRFRRITVQVGMFATVLTSGIKSVAIADPEVADLVVLSSRSVLVNGKSRGVTNLVLWDVSGIRTYEVRVVDRMTNTASEVERSIDLPRVRVRMLGEAVVLDGDVDNQEQSARAKAIAGLYAEKIIDLVTVGEGAGTERPKTAKEIKEAIGNPAVEVRVVGESAVLKGTVKDDAQKEQAERIAILYVPQVLNFVEVEKQPEPTPTPPEPPPTLEEIKSMIGVASVQVRTVRDRIILEGEVPNVAAKDRAGTLAALSNKTVDNLLTTPEEKRVVTEAKVKTVQDAIGVAGITVQGTEDKLILKGTAASQAEADRAVKTAQGFSNNVESLIEVTKTRQVRIDVMIVEIGLNKVKDLGFAPADVFGGGGGYISLKAAVEAHANSDGLRGAFGSTDGGIASTLKLLQTRKQAKILSAPSTTVLSGKQADFKVGGEIPLPLVTTSANGNTQSVEFKDFGIQLNVKPTVSGDKDVNMVLKTEVSGVDETRPAVFVAGTAVPAFSTKSAQTEVLVKDGETLIIGGLIDHKITKSLTTIPGLSKIPILGELFTSRSFQRQETEMVIFVTPRVSVVSGS